MAMFAPDLLSTEELVNRIAELEAAAAATLHVNQHLNKEIEKCIRGVESAQSECQAWKGRTNWLRKQLVQAHKQQRAAAAGHGEPFDEAGALMELLAAEEAGAQAAAVAHVSQGACAAASGQQSDAAAYLQPTESQAVLIRKLVAKGAAAGWLIDPTEVQLGHVLGRGEFGITYKAHWRGATVAVKCVRTRSAADYNMFLREVEALAALRHPHVLPFLGACLQGPERLWLVTEFMEGGTMAAWLHPQRYAQKSPQEQQQQQQVHGQPHNDGAFGPGVQQHAPNGDSTNGSTAPSSWQHPQPQGSGSSGGSRGPQPFLERVRVVYEVAQGLLALESLQPPLLHRDIKPSNIFIDGGGHARVGDFGLARRLFPEAVADLTGETGTYLYMAPEVMRHEIYDNRADVWSWGVLLVEAMTNQTPYSWTFMTPEQIALGVAEEKLMPMIPDHVDVDLQAVARLALAFSPEDRPPFSLITQELASTYHKMSSKQVAGSGGPSLLASVSKQLSNSWVTLLGRIWATPGLVGATAKQPAPAVPPGRVVGGTSAVSTS